MTVTLLQPSPLLSGITEKAVIKIQSSTNKPLKPLEAHLYSVYPAYNLFKPFTLYSRCCYASGTLSTK
uniref:Uncharacterized protein n=1 Tax=uncultured Desulfobacterium sp. TaxID=201089 RepID=E1YKQ2_9BACT|nr:unknown protein [uncultured Desulfobacterium sp.]